MRLGVLSDTHDNLALVKVAARFFADAEVDQVLHLGDITGREVVEALAHLPITYIRGNNDDPAILGPALREVGAPALLDAWDAKFEGVHISATHGHAKGLLNARLGAVDVLLRGHSHAVGVTEHGRTRVVNPGALQRAPVKTVVIVELPSMEWSFHEVLYNGVRPFSL